MTIPETILHIKIQTGTLILPGFDNGNDIMESNGLSQGTGMSPQSMFRYITTSAMVDDT